ncbi:transposase [Streptomyces sp. UG1]|uniref:transposase n=1 Tax=Streptomyces sp. UG1 TaxID=3417652 RepID=UPI003CEC1126
MLPAPACCLPARGDPGLPVRQGSRDGEPGLPGFGGGKSINGRKRLTAVDMRGVPPAVMVTKASPHDRVPARDQLFRRRLTHPVLTAAWVDSTHGGTLVDWSAPSSASPPWSDASPALPDHPARHHTSLNRGKRPSNPRPYASRSRHRRCAWPPPLCAAPEEIRAGQEVGVRRP